MENAKLRKLLINLHLLGAGFMAPAFCLVAITGGLHMVGGGESVATSPIKLPAGTQVDLKSKTATEDVRAILKAANVDVKVEYLRIRGTSFETRPTSRTHVKFKPSPNGLVATLNKPNFQKAMMEVHKGHGPKVLRTYHKIVALTLFLVIFGGVLIGLLSKAYRGKTLAALGLGTLIYVIAVGFL